MFGCVILVQTYTANKGRGEINQTAIGVELLVLKSERLILLIDLALNCWF
jgi:hypothetical protein